MFLSLGSVSTVAMVLVIGYLAAKLYLRFDTAKEERREGAYKAAVLLEDLGLTHTAEFYLAYAKGDKSGMAAKAIQLGKLLAKGGPAVALELDKVTERVLAHKVKSEAGRAHLALILKGAEQPTDPAKGPAVAVVK